MGELTELEEAQVPGVTTLSDNTLLTRIAEGDEETFQAVFTAHYDRVYGLLYRLVGTRVEAEDLAQEVFLKLHQHAFARRFLRRREHNIGAWLYRTATNVGYNAIRGRKRRWQRDTLLVPDPRGAPSAEEEVARREQETAVRRTLAQLPERDAQLLLLRQIGLTYAECAEIIGVKASSVGTLLARAAAAFRKTHAQLHQEVYDE